VAPLWSVSETISANSDTGQTSGSVTVTAIQDTDSDPGETVTLEITGVTGATEDGDQSQTVTIGDDDLPPTFLVTSLEATSTGFLAQFNADVDTSVSSQGDTSDGAFGADDLVVTGATSGPVTGSFVFNDPPRTLTFIATGGPLVADTYTVAMRSADNGFRDTAGNLLDDRGGEDRILDQATVDEIPAEQTDDRVIDEIPMQEHRGALWKQRLVNQRKHFTRIFRLERLLDREVEETKAARLIRCLILVSGKQRDNRVDPVLDEPGDLLLAPHPAVLEAVASNALANRQPAGDHPFETTRLKTGQDVPFETSMRFAR